MPNKSSSLVADACTFGTAIRCGKSNGVYRDETIVWKRKASEPNTKILFGSSEDLIQREKAKRNGKVDFHIDTVTGFYYDNTKYKIVDYRIWGKLVAYVQYYNTGKITVTFNTLGYNTMLTRNRFDAIIKGLTNDYDNGVRIKEGHFQIKRGNKYYSFEDDQGTQEITFNIIKDKDGNKNIIFDFE
jgi:hypothetical protein